MYREAVKSIRRAFREVNSFSENAWDGDYRIAAREALKKVLEGKMEERVEMHLDEVKANGVVDRRNGYFPRHLLTEIGDLELSIPRTRTFSAIGTVRRFARRTDPVERTLLLSFVLGLSTRKVSCALLPILGVPISAQTVSRVARQLDQCVEAYHKRPLEDKYEVLILDGIVLKRRTGAGAQKRTVLVALGIRPDGKKEIIDFQQATSESQYAWEGFLNNLYHRGLVGSTLKLIVVDGGTGLEAALPLVFGQIDVQRCWAHKTRNVLNCVKKGDQASVKRSLHRISHALNLTEAQHTAGQFVKRWEPVYPKATRCLTKDLPDLLTFLRVPLTLKRTALRTTNAIERRFKEVRRRTRPMGTFSDHTSIDRIMLAVFTHENQKQGVTTPFLLTQTI